MYCADIFIYSPSFIHCTHCIWGEWRFTQCTIFEVWNLWFVDTEALATYQWLNAHYFIFLNNLFSLTAEETEELLQAEDRISERSSTSTCSKETGKDRRSSEETHKVKPDSDTDESELSSEDDSSSSSGKRKYNDKDVLEKLSVNPLIDSTGADNDPMAGMELDQFTGDSLEPCPAPCTLNSQESEYYQGCINVPGMTLISIRRVSC